ncbi:hypothetical protein KXW08_008397, partial [Aspergillus fumigatus]
RWVSTDALWKWVDTNGKDFGIGRPYLDRDPPHVGPMDGQEYVSRRGAPKAAAADAKQPAAQPTQDKPAAKRKDAAKPNGEGPAASACRPASVAREARLHAPIPPHSGVTRRLRPGIGRAFVAHRLRLVPAVTHAGAAGRGVATGPA